MTAVAFNYALWAARFPALAATVDEALATSYFAEAGFFVDPASDCPISDPNERLTLLNLVVAHIAALNKASRDAAAAALVGRISSVTEGSVTIATELGSFNGDQAAYFAQTPYGVQYWAMTGGYRTMHYVPGPQPFLGVPGYGGLGWRR